MEPVLVTQAYLPPREEYDKYLDKIWESHWLTNNGELHDKLAKKLEEYLGVSNVTLFVNGHSALDVVFKAMNLTGEVITTPFTFASTTHAIVMNGLTPIFADIKPSDCTIDEEQAESLITPRTSAIVAVHVYGCPCNVSALADIARRHHLKLIYDAAHAFGVKVDGKGIGSFGDVSMMSFHATKVFNTIEGGALLYDDASYTRIFNLYKNFGITGPEHVEAVGLNAKMNEFQAAMGLAVLPHVDEEIKKRKALTEAYRSGLKGIPGIRFLGDMKNVEHNYAYFPIFVDESEYGRTRDELFEALGEQNVFPRKYFYPITSDFECFKGRYDYLALPNARYAADHVMTLPLYGALQIDTAKDIADMIREMAK
ncbi:MAG: DegT/DnrJ/EryC1/StrS family aminotransferase [Schwartzia sp.]|nr:DegT/DnrJ/EryC1/StrS family aminotransferase [Schwartzia sp. (in: firmicutes)]